MEHTIRVRIVLGQCVTCDGIELDAEYPADHHVYRDMLGAARAFVAAPTAPGEVVIAVASGGFTSAQFPDVSEAASIIGVLSRSEWPPCAIVGDDTAYDSAANVMGGCMAARTFLNGDLYDVRVGGGPGYLSECRPEPVPLSRQPRITAVELFTCWDIKAPRLTLAGLLLGIPNLTIQSFANASRAAEPMRATLGELTLLTHVYYSCNGLLSCPTCVGKRHRRLGRARPWADRGARYAHLAGAFPETLAAFSALEAEPRQSAAIDAMKTAFVREVLG